MGIGNEKGLDMSQQFLAILKKLEEEEKHRSDIMVPLNQVRMLDNGFLQTADGRDLRWGEHGFVQFCQELEMPAKYMRKLMGEKPDFVAQQANHFLQKKDSESTRRFRLYDDKIQGIVSESYVPYDDVELFGTMYEMLDRFPQGQITGFYRDDKRTQMRIRFPEVKKNVGISEEDGKEDILMGGITIGNSQVAYAKLTVLPLIWRQVCTNGMMGWGEGEGLKQRHIHFDPLTIKGQIEKGVMVAVDTTKTLMDQMEMAREIRVKNPIDEIEKYAKRINLRKKQIEGIQQAYYHEPQANLFSIVNAFTRYARDLKNNEAQTEIERFAGSLLRQVA